MESAIRSLLENFTLTLFVVGLIFSAVTLARAEKPLTAPVVIEAFFKWFLLFSIGVAYLYGFVIHVFFGDLAAKFIGWENSPFQREVGFANLGVGLLGVLAFSRSGDMRLAAIVSAAAFLWGAAAGHVREMVVNSNFHPGNAGVVFWSDILVPAIGFALLYLQHRHGRPSPSASSSASATQRADDTASHLSR